jgi:hypothetical protein
VFSSTVTVVTSLINVVNSLFDPRNRPPRGRAMQRLGDGMVHVEYPEDDYVYLVTVQQVPRTVLPLERPIAVGEPNRMPVQLIQVAVANHVEVTLDAAPGPARDAALAAFGEGYRRWERDDDQGRPPAWPAEQFGTISIAVVDDLGTVYRRESGEAGGHGTEFRSRWNFLPAPPAAAGWLTLRFTPQAGTPVEVELSLPGTAAV